jgi:hypothetical protein
MGKAKKAIVPIQVEREVARLRARNAELERVAKMAHDTIADVAGTGANLATVDIDTTFRELVRVLFIDK